MTDYRLNETPPLGHIDVEALDIGSGGVRLMEEAGRAIIAMTTRRGMGVAMAEAFEGYFGRPPPDARSGFSLGKKGGKTGGRIGGEVAGKITVMASALDQVFIIADSPPPVLEESLKSAFDACATLTDQSDGWARLILAGAGASQTLERLSMVDLTPQNFKVGGVARTVFHHINVIIMRTPPRQDEGLRYIILTPRSSAQDLCHAVLESPPFGA